MSNFRDFVKMCTNRIPFEEETSTSSKSNLENTIRLEPK